MEYKGDAFISVHYKRDDYNELKLQTGSCKEGWESAIEIFKDRINGRYIERLNLLIQNADINSDGFVIMAIDCLLIETLLQFRKGLDETTPGRNKQEYVDFLVNNFSINFDRTTATRFYQDIRCGILHSAQTKKGSRITFSKEQLVTKLDGVLSYDVLILTNILKEYVNIYIEEIKDIANKELRKNFIKKMNFICDR